MGDYIMHNGMIYGEDELRHYGVLGMKWGIRRYQNKDGSLTRLGKERAKTLGKDGIDKISDKDNLKIAKNTSLYRISTKQTEAGDIRYLTYRQNDRNFYKGYWGQQLREGKPDAKLYEQTYDAIHDIFIPSAKTRRSILSNLLGDDDVIKSICTDDYGNYSRQAEHNLRTQTKFWTASERANYVSKWLGHRPDILTKYGEQIVSRGFNAVIDDSGRSVGEMPLIVFTSNKTLYKQRVEQVDRFVEEFSQQLYSELDAKKYRYRTASI